MLLMYFCHKHAHQCTVTGTIYSACLMLFCSFRMFSPVQTTYLWQDSSAYGSWYFSRNSFKLHHFSL